MQELFVLLIIIIVFMIIGNREVHSTIVLMFLPIFLFWVYLEGSYLIDVLQGEELLDGGAMVAITIVQIPAFFLMSPALIGFALGIGMFKKRWSNEPLPLMLAAIGISFLVSMPYLYFSQGSYIVLVATLLGSLSVAIQLGMRRYRRIKQ